MSLDGAETLLVILASFVFMASSCDGELPPYRDPTDVLQGKMDGIYALSLSTNTLRVYLVLENTFDETLQGTATFDGLATITSTRDPNIHKTFKLTAANIIHARSYNPSTRVLTIDPGGDYVKLEAIWNFIDDNGTDLTQNFFRYENDPTCPGRRIGLPEFLLLTGELKVFDRINTVKAKTKLFQLCHVDPYVSPNFCPPIFDCPD